MNASDFVKISTTVTDDEKVKFDFIYNEILVPLITKQADNKKRELRIMDDHHYIWVSDKLRHIGVGNTLQYEARKMGSYLMGKGFGLEYSPYFTVVKW